ncbi:YwbE family protein [Erysipelothrix inopinata]|uniref:YwbE family protein n=1 Tax=Erysipelothrix inopinata TaxID=225084 RepID=A0A7G9S0U0_9FIRM|nr:YwbE family protein [Erysipelothrix inopinata]QNN61465.1 YwbE family protein [Erysipelothrix inopinata]
MDPKQRKNIKPGLHVLVVQKQDQRTGVTTEGYVDRLLTNSQYHPHGIKVMLQSGIVGRVCEILDDHN